MKAISLNFKIHQPYRLKRYRFFNIGIDHIYADDTLNASIMNGIADSCYYELNNCIVNSIKNHKDKIKIGISASGVALQQIKELSPSTFLSLKSLAKTGNAEFLAQTYSHSLVSITDDTKELKRQVEKYCDYVKKEFGLESSTFCNTGLIYSNDIAQKIKKLGFKTIITEGKTNILDWRSPNYLYKSIEDKPIDVLTRNVVISDFFRLRNLTNFKSSTEMAKDFVEKLKQTDGDVITIYVDYTNFHQIKGVNAVEYLKTVLDEIAKSDELVMMTPSEISKKHTPVGIINSKEIVSGIDDEKDESAWLMNYMQLEAYEKLFSVGDNIRKKNNEELFKAWDILQSSDHLLYTSTKTDARGNTYDRFSPYPSPYEAFINYMNILSDFIIQVEKSEKK